MAVASLAQVFPSIPESLQTNLIQVFISAPFDVQDDVNILLQVSIMIRYGLFFSISVSFVGACIQTTASVLQWRSHPSLDSHAMWRPEGNLWGMCFTFILFKSDLRISSYHEQEKYSQSRCHAIDRATIFVAFLRNQTDRYTTSDYNLGHLNSPGGRPAIFCFKDSEETL